MNEAVSIMEYRYKKYTKVSGEINLRYDEVVIYKENGKIDMRKQYIKQYLQLLSRKILTI